MQKQISPKIVAFTFGILVFSFLVAFYVVAWQEPGSAPPTGNVSAPLNTSNTGQSKAGGLILNTGNAVNGLIVATGTVGIGTNNPTQKLDVAGYIKGQSGLCIGNDCKSNWADVSGGVNITYKMSPVSYFNASNNTYYAKTLSYSCSPDPTVSAVIIPPTVDGSYTMYGNTVNACSYSTNQNNAAASNYVIRQDEVIQQCGYPCSNYYSVSVVGSCTPQSFTERTNCWYPCNGTHTIYCKLLSDVYPGRVCSMSFMCNKVQQVGQ